MPEEQRLLTIEEFSAAREVLTNTPLSRPELFAHLLTKSGRIEAKRIQAFWMASDRARVINPRNKT